ncbi:MAG: hypothetical protein KBA61_13575 [Spirochaetes bacterium]|nr:hypothetical protein [Spirochaetota bacterium]
MAGRFALEAARLMGRDPGGNWQGPLFSAMSDAIEITALQRGVERWERVPDVRRGFLVDQ